LLLGMRAMVNCFPESEDAGVPGSDVGAEGLQPAMTTQMARRVSGTIRFMLLMMSLRLQQESPIAAAASRIF